MKEWFKARNIWGAAITALSDEEAGKLAKAIWLYTMEGKTVDIEGAGKGIYAMILLTLGQDEERDSDISAKRSMATAGIRNKKKLDNIKSDQMISNDIKNNQMISNDDNKNKNKNKNIEQESESEFIADDEAHRIMEEQNQLLNVAESAGFGKSEIMRGKLIDLYAIHGKDKMIEAIDECVIHGVTNIAYLTAVLKGEPKKPKKQEKMAVVPAQDYEQRDYSGETEAAIERMMEGWSK